MLIKLSLRNAKRTWRDYLVFFVTLLLIAAIMFSFNGLLFDPDIRRLQDDSAIMAVMLGIATFFILLVLTWLLQYMVRFMMSKRSREFATYLLLGMKRRQISKIFWGESLVLGIAAFLLGTGCGIFFPKGRSADHWYTCYQCQNLYGGVKRLSFRHKCTFK